MYYIRIDAENTNKLIYYCRHCGNEDHLITLDSATVSKTKGKPTVSHFINKYTKLDPTLPRVSHILCPNVDCATNKAEDKREILYIRYDDLNMKYVYLCSTCDTVWKAET